MRLKLKNLSTDFEKRLGELEIEIHKIAGREFNVGSPKQLGEILFDEQKLPGGKRNKNGSWATDASVLDDLAAQGHPLPVKILEHRQLAKLKGTYTDALVREVDAKTGRVHTSYHMTGAATGRLASTDPNLQNIPVRSEEGRKIRQAFIAEKGHKLLSADYSQIELRLLAHVADIPALEGGLCARRRHPCLTASDMFGVPVKGIDPLMRRAPRRSTSASSTASRPSASPTSSASASRRRRSTSASTSSAIPASATTWSGPRTTRASTATC